MQPLSFDITESLQVTWIISIVLSSRSAASISKCSRLRLVEAALSVVKYVVDSLPACHPGSQLKAIFQITLHAGPLLDDPKRIATISRSAAVQYRLRDSGATYFGKGTSAVVL